MENSNETFDLVLKKGKHLEIYNIGTSEKISIKKLAFLIASLFKKKLNYRLVIFLKVALKTGCPILKK